jgi:hypothetical protein
MEECEATWASMMDAINASDRKLARTKYFLYHEQVDNLEKTLGITITRHELDIQMMLFIMPPPECIIRD